MSLRKNLIAGGVTTLFILCLIVLGIYHQLVFPVMSGTIITRDNKSISDQKINLPIIFKDAEHGYYDVNINMYLQSIYPKKFFVIVDDCISDIQINGQMVGSDIQINGQMINKNLVYCKPKGDIFDFGPYINEGANSIQFTLEDNSGGWGTIAITPAASDNLMRFFKALFALLVLSYGLIICRIFRVARKQYIVFLLIFTCGIFGSMFQFERVHMQSDNIDYSYTYSIDKFRITNENIIKVIDSSVELDNIYEPPLYRWIINRTISLADYLGRPLQLAIEDLYRINFLVFLFIIVATLWVGKILLPRKDDCTQWLLFAAAVGFLPGVGYLASATNGAAGLLFLFSILCLGFLLRWIKKNQWSDFILSIIAVNLAILTHEMGVVLIFVLIGALLIFPKNKIPSNIRKIITILSFIGAMLIWFLYLRNGSSFVINLQAIMHDRSISLIDLFPNTNSILHTLTFFDLEKNIQINTLFMSFYREALFAGFYLPDTFNSVIHVMLLIGTAFLLLGVVGIAYIIWHRNKMHQLLIIFVVVVLIGNIFISDLFTGTVPKFSLLSSIVIPITYIVIHAVRILPKNIRWAGKTMLSTYFVICIGIYYLFL